MASQKGHLQAVQGLLSAGASKDEVTKDGITPFHLAVRSGQQQIVARSGDKGKERDVQCTASLELRSYFVWNLGAVVES